MKKEYEMKCYPGDEPRILVTDEFVSKNKLVISLESARKELKKEGMFCFNQDVAIEFLPLKETKHLLQGDYVNSVKSGTVKHVVIIDVYEAVQVFLDYMVFAWMKANDERGLSASRSINKLACMIRILGRDDIGDILEDEGLYAPYGKPALRKACDMLDMACPKYIK